MHFGRGGSFPVMVFCQVQNSLASKSLFSYIGSVTARHSSIRRQPNFAAFMLQGSHPVRHWAVELFSLSYVRLFRVSVLWTDSAPCRAVPWDGC